MKRYLALLLLSISLARSSAQPLPIAVYALPDHTAIGANVAYVASVRSTNMLQSSLTMTVTARLSDITLESIPAASCSARNNITHVIVWCAISESPTAITLRGTLLGGTRRIVTVTGEIDGVIAQDVQFVSGVDTLYLPMLHK